MARHYLPLRDGYHFEVGQGVSELSFEGHQSGINAISLVRRAPMPIRAEFGRKSVEAEPPFLFLSFQGEGGRLFGAITSQEISDALKEQHGIEIEKNKLVQSEPIKSFGSFEVKCKLGYEVSGKISVLVTEKK